MAKKITVLFVVLFVFVMGIIALGMGAKTTEAQAPGTPKAITGWAWSSNIGWIKFDPTGGASDVYYNPGNGAVSGYAWSPNIGWVDFGPSGGYPAAPNSGAALPASHADGPMTGWAKAITGSMTGGWDGWIKLSDPSWAPDTDGLKGVTRVTGSGGKGYLKGYAWGSEVVGWVNFDPAINAADDCDPITPGVQTVCIDPGGSLTVVCSANNNNPTVDIPATVTWKVVASSGSGPYTFGNWSGAVSGAGVTSGNQNTISNSTPFNGPPSTKTASITVSDTTESKTCSAAIDVVCPSGKTWGDTDGDGTPSCETGGGPGTGGNLTLIGGSNTTIATQGVNPVASIPAIKIQNTSITDPVNGIKIASLTDNAGGHAFPTDSGLEFSCRLSLTPNPPMNDASWKPCNQALGDIPASVSPDNYYFAIKVNKYDKAANLHAPYVIKLTNSDGSIELKKQGTGVPVNVIFKYTAGGIDPR